MLLNALACRPAPVGLNGAWSLQGDGVSGLVEAHPNGCRPGVEVLLTGVTFGTAGGVGVDHVPGGGEGEDFLAGVLGGLGYGGGLILGDGGGHRLKAGAGQVVLHTVKVCDLGGRQHGQRVSSGESLGEYS